MKKFYSIGEVAKIKDVTIKALRYYHKMGILIPRYTDETTGYRYYTIDQFVYIDIIKACRTLGTSIVELQEIFKECETEKLLQFLQVKRVQAEEQINKLKEVIDNIDRLNEGVEASKQLLNNDEITIQFFKARSIITVPCKEVGSFKEVLYYSELEKVIQDKKLEASVERGILYAVSLEGKIEPRYAFNVIEGEVMLEKDSSIERLPAGKYLTLAYSKENEKERISKLFDYIKSHKLSVKNLIEVELLNDFFNIESYSCQLQIQIEESLIKDLQTEDDLYIHKNNII